MYINHPILRSRLIFLPQTTSACNIPRFLKEPILLPIFLVFNGLPIHPGELFGALRGLLAERLPRARNTPDEELPEARRDWVISRHEIMMGREFQIAQYRGFLHELHERTANRAANNGRVIAPPEVVDDSSSEEEFDIHDYDMSLP
ncbi:hypothetical protein BOTNAR_0013g00500 [Botryotinia narcissicola]|uniref:Uncharacterized protein n=1 Tax=Botryotinia narcissicola TaxID=278944 RepID=A0A4Z1JJV5_9HELO|nr:hypothetical protein BOTNAR_0013g00500 [Botryotinia narcissicola]